MSEIRVVLTSAPPAVADGLVETLVRERLVACGNVLPGVRSTYVWKGELCRDEEALIVMETTTARLPETLARLRALHPYECPKIVALEPAAVDGDYAAWVRAACSTLGAGHVDAQVQHEE